MKKILKLSLVVLLLSGLWACQQEEKEKEVKKDYQVGEVAVYEDIEYTVTKVEKSQGDDFDQPAEGKEYVIVYVKIENKSDEKVSYNGLDFKMLDSQGVEEGETFSIINQKTSLGSGDLISGGVKEGTLIFEQKIDDQLKLNLYSNIFSDEAAITFVL